MKKTTLLFSFLLYLLCMSLAGCGTNTAPLPGGTSPVAYGTGVPAPDATIQAVTPAPADDQSTS
ncbi:MAG: hypothetical protein K2G16_01450, partial [Lachnospiraceae bacterium]|nr:hypothetical protein [Lachnospiraceae bacterium]